MGVTNFHLIKPAIIHRDIYKVLTCLLTDHPIIQSYFQALRNQIRDCLRRFQLTKSPRLRKRSNKTPMYLCSAFFLFLWPYSKGTYYTSRKFCHVATKTLGIELLQAVAYGFSYTALTFHFSKCAAKASSFVIFGNKLTFYKRYNIQYFKVQVTRKYLIRLIYVYMRSKRKNHYLRYLTSIFLTDISLFKLHKNWIKIGAILSMCARLVGSYQFREDEPEARTRAYFNFASTDCKKCIHKRARASCWSRATSNSK